MLTLFQPPNLHNYINLSGQTWSARRGDQDDSEKLAIGRFNVELHSYLNIYYSNFDPMLLV